MPKSSYLSISILAIIVSLNASAQPTPENNELSKAEEDYQHFPALEAPDLKTALCNLRNYNDKLSNLATKTEISTADMVKVHELTYTLENALARVQQDLVVAAANLEKVHKASEILDQGSVANFSQLYLEKLNTLSNNNCN